MMTVKGRNWLVSYHHRWVFAWGTISFGQPTSTKLVSARHFELIAIDIHSHSSIAIVHIGIYMFA
jgi:hypothetical protein